jgi:hypothetical protein
MLEIDVESVVAACEGLLKRDATSAARHVA